MSDFPPLPRYLTLEEAAQALTDRTGKAWTPRQILGCAERHEISVFARIGHAVKFVRVKSIEGRTNEIAADAGSLPLLDTEAIRALLLAGEAHSRGWEELATIDFFGEPVEVWKTVFELAPGQEAPLVRPDVCRVTAAGLLQLADTFTQPEPAQKAETPPPVATESASGDVEMASQAKPLQRTAAQDTAILSEIKKQGYDPLALPRNPNGKPGAKAAIRIALSRNQLFTGSTVFDKAWERLTAREEIVIQG